MGYVDRRWNYFLKLLAAYEKKRLQGSDAEGSVNHH
jgi:hypothetical protein